MKKEITKKEYRTVVSSFEVRSAGDSASPVIMGYAARFNELSDPIMGMFYERIAPGAFDLAIERSDPRALFNHDPNHVLGRKSAGTLRLKITADGLHYEITPPKSSFVADLIESMKRGDIKESSFAFSVESEEWIDPEKAGDLPIRVIRRVGRLYDVSPVTYPAYPSATSEARSAKDVFAGYTRKRPERLQKTGREDRPTDADADEYEREKRAYTERRQPANPQRSIAEMEKELRRLEGKPEEDIDMSQEQNEKRTMGEFLKQVRAGTVPQESRAAEGQNYTVNADGGYLVAPEYAKELLKLVESESILYPRVSKVPMSVGNTLVVNMLDASQRNGGAEVFWTKEAQEIQSSKLQFARKSVILSKLTAMAYATDELLEDSVLMESEIRKAFTSEFAAKIDESILKGDGVADTPLGIMNQPSLLTVGAESGQAAASIVPENIMKMWVAMPPKNRAKAVWLINPSVELALMKMIMETGAATGVPVFLPPAGLATAPYGTLLGKPIIPTDLCATLGSLGDVVFIDPTAYNWVERTGLKADTSIHVLFSSSQTAFRFSSRCTGFSAWTEPVNGRSPFVTLAPRTNP